MMKVQDLVGGAAFALMLLSGVSALAQDDTAEAAPQETTYDFDDDVVEGSLLRPDGDLIGGQRHGKQSSLINIRADFVPELVRSAEQL